MLTNSQITEEYLKEVCGNSTFQRGRAYFEQGRVIILDNVDEFDDFDNEGILQALVRGSERRPYTVTIELEDDDFSIESCSCSCPIGYECKHIVATLLQAQEEGLLLANPSIHSNLQKKDNIQKESYSLDLSDIVEPQKNEETQFQKWMKQYNPFESQFPMRSIKQKKEMTHVLLYVLKMVVYPHTAPKLTIRLEVVRLLKQGGYGVSKAFSFNSQAQYEMLESIDQENIHRLELMYKQHYFRAKNSYDDFELQGDKASLLLTELINTGRCYWDNHRNTLPLCHGTPKHADFRWELNNKGEQKLTLYVGENPTIVLPLNQLWYVTPTLNTCGYLENTIEPRLASSLLYSPPILPQDVAIVQKTLTERFSDKNSFPLPMRLPIKEKADVVPKPQLQLFGTELQSTYDYKRKTFHSEILPLGRVCFIYDTMSATIDSPPTLEFYDKTHKEVHKIIRNLKQENQLLNDITQHGFPLVSEYYKTTVKEKALKSHDFLISRPNDDTAQYSFLYQIIPELEQKGWKVVVEPTFPMEYLMTATDWYTEVSESEIDWFNMELGIVVDGEKINILPALVNAIQHLKKDFFTKQSLNEDCFKLELPSGKKIRLPFERIQGIVSVLTELFDATSLNAQGQLAISLYRASQVFELEKAMACEKMRWLGSEKLLELNKKLSTFEGIQSVTLPALFKGTLRNYQKQGVDWLNFLREYRLGGILADDMGLGKTVQTLAHLAIEKSEARLQKPCLIIAPTSLMENWRRESAQFTPSLKVLTLHGNQRKTIFANIASHDIVLSSYPLLIRDQDELLKHDYSMIILDEAQHVKNSNTKTYQILRQLKSDHRLCLTGTPMENHLGELWSLFNFLSPGFLGHSKQFTEIFKNPIERYRDVFRTQSLQQRIRPYLLRRTKENVLKELPPKTVIIQKIQFENEQLDLYESIRLAMDQKVKNALKDKGLAKSQIIILDALLKLRQVCCDPRLLSLTTAKKVKRSAKLDCLMEMLPELIENGRRILLFSSFTSMLSLIELELKKQKINYVKLTGSTTDRITPVQKFQKGEVPLFLISLKAGGTGLNLTAADVVIHYDPWWNPAAEAQATDRAHRIGQTKSVFVYKLITAGTVEEKIVTLQEKKQSLLSGILDESQEFESGKITADDLKFLFQPINELECRNGVESQQLT